MLKIAIRIYHSTFKLDTQYFDLIHKKKITKNLFKFPNNKQNLSCLSIYTTYNYVKENQQVNFYPIDC